MKRIFLLLATVLFASSAFSQLPSTSLLAWYPFCADTTDHSGNGRDLIVNNGITNPPLMVNNRFGTASNAMNFNGANNAMNTATFFTSAGEFSYSCWMNASGPQSSVVIYNGNAAASGFGLAMNNGTIGQPGDSLSILFGNMGQYLSTEITLNTWHHIVFTKTVNTFELYIDTVLVGSFTGLFYPLITGSDVFNVGYNTATGDNAFFGQIDDIAVFSRKISKAEVRSLYAFNPDVPLFTLGNDTAVCSSSIILAPSTQTPAGNYTWGTGTTTVAAVTDTTWTVSPPDFPGEQYWLTITKPFGCTATDSIAIRHITVLVDLGRDDSFCGNTIHVLDDILLTVPGTTFLWSTGSTASSINVTTSGTYWLQIDSLGCLGSDTINIGFHQPPIVTLPPDDTVCDGTPVLLTPGVIVRPSGPAFPTYLWEANPILSAPVTTPTFLVTVSGTYWVTVTDSLNCAGRDTIHLEIKNDALIFTLGDTAMCLGDVFQVPSTMVVSNPAATYQWVPTTGLLPINSANPTLVTTVSATYVLTSKVPGCPDRVDSFHLDVQPVPIIQYMGAPRSVCIGDTIHIKVDVLPADYEDYLYSWSPGSMLDDSTKKVVVFHSGDTTNMIVTVSTPFGCKAVDSIMVNAHPSEFFDWDTTFHICPGDSVQLWPTRKNPPIPEPTDITWQTTPTMYVPFPTDSNAWIYPITNISYTTVGTSQFGCRDTGFMTVYVHPAALVYLTDSVTIHPGESYLITPQTNCTRFSWWPELGLSDTAIADPLATPTANTLYFVQASTEWGCQVRDSIKIRVEDTKLVLPNAFVPGSNVNNRFKIIKMGIASLTYFRIYNRWGNLVYESSDIEAGWDGTYNGKPQPFGVYIYDIEAKTSTGKPYKVHGNVTLIR